MKEKPRNARISLLRYIIFLIDRIFPPMTHALNWFAGPVRCCSCITDNSQHPIVGVERGTPMRCGNGAEDTLLHWVTGSQYLGVSYCWRFLVTWSPDSFGHCFAFAFKISHWRPGVSFFAWGSRNRRFITLQYCTFLSN